MTRRPRGRPRHPDVLTPAEWSVLDMLRHGMSRRQIAERRGVSLDAVKYHVENISGKLGVAGVAALRHWPGYPASSPMTRRSVPMPTATDLALGPIGQVSLLARDIARVETFYRDTLGLPHVFTFGDLAFFDASGTRLFIRAVPEEEWKPSSILYFTVDDIRAAFAASRRVASTRPEPRTSSTVTRTAASKSGWPSSRTAKATPWPSCRGSRLKARRREVTALGPGSSSRTGRSSQLCGPGRATYDTGDARRGRTGRRHPGTRPRSPPA